MILLAIVTYLIIRRRDITRAPGGEERGGEQMTEPPMAEAGGRLRQSHLREENLEPGGRLNSGDDNLRDSG